jgi:acyl-[acyl-carrier-protein]-phospholipid O-acyltransferase / long-chain-fatty-acid--[acyl-carrier-protein] ligase
MTLSSKKGLGMAADPHKLSTVSPRSAHSSLMFATLMTTRRFAPLFWCQFFSAFNDNFLKNSLVFLILFKLAGADAESLITLAGATLMFPFFILSAIGGEIADRYDKARVAERLKFVEIGVAALAVVGFWLHSIPLLFLALFLFGVIAALFGPIKYGILPDHLTRSELPTGNALIESATFIAILTGTIAGGLAAMDGPDEASFASVMMVFALASWTSARLIPPTAQAAPDLQLDFNFVRSTFRLLGALKAEPRLWWGGLVTSWFWVVGAIALSLLPPLVKNVLGGDNSVITAFLAVFAVAIGVGSALASCLARGRIVLFPTLLGAVLLSLFALDLSWATWDVRSVTTVGLADVFKSGRGLRVAADLAVLAIAGGLFIVPAFSAIQAWAGADRRARIVAAVNVLNAAFMTVAGIGVALLQNVGATPSMLFLAIGAANFVVALIMARTMPTNPMRLPVGPASGSLPARGPRTR